ncbi:hypothetical protein D3C80_2098580 [compost metagenome]
MIIYSFNTQFIDRLFTTSNVFRVLDDKQHARIAGSCLRVHQTVKSKAEITSSYRITIRPFRVIAQMESVDQTVFRNIP